MDAQAAETAIKAFIKDILEQFEQAAGVAKAGQVGLPEPPRGLLRRPFSIPRYRSSTKNAKTSKKMAAALEELLSVEGGPQNSGVVLSESDTLAQWKRSINSGGISVPAHCLRQFASAVSVGSCRQTTSIWCNHLACPTNR
jgi:hypothetical protein